MGELIQQGLPGEPGPKLKEAWEALPWPWRPAVREHLLGGTSAEFLSAWFERFGHPVSASTIRTYRRSLRQGGV